MLGGFPHAKQVNPQTADQRNAKRQLNSSHQRDGYGAIALADRLEAIGWRYRRTQ
jgi:hypothetical protein